MYINWFNDWLKLHIFDSVRPHDPPTDVSGPAIWGWLLIAVLAAQFAVGIALAVRWTRRDPQLFPRPMVLMLFLTPFICTFQEALGDWEGGLWYSKDTPLILFTMLERPIPFWVALLWFAWIPLGTMIVYRMVATGVSVRTIVITAVALGFAEMGTEAVACNTGLMDYYGYFVTVFGVPPTQFLTNGFMYVFIGVALAYLVPWLQNSSLGAWKWTLVVPTVMGGFIACLTLALPLFIVGALLREHPLVNWACTLLGLVLTVVGSLALLNSKWVKLFRDHRAAISQGGVAMDEVAAN